MVLSGFGPLSGHSPSTVPPSAGAWLAVGLARGACGTSSSLCPSNWFCQSSRKKSGWNWRAPFGKLAHDNEPAVHLTFDEAQKICKFQGKRLPTDAEWVKAAYLEQRDQAPAGFTKGQRYTFPNGASARQSHCLNGCGNYAGQAPKGALWRGVGHVLVMTTPPGVNGLFDMGGNVWEWVDTGQGAEKVTRGASWWYDADRQIESDVATKPRDTRVGYIGFRCVQDQ